MTRLRRQLKRREHRGAAAVEFALVMVILFPILFGIIQYGFYFNDYLQARQAARQSAREAVVLLTPTCGGNAANTPLAMKCRATSLISPASGPVAARVSVPSGWTVGQPLLVCTVVHTADVTGMLPMPNGGYATAKTQMSIEQATTTPTGFPAADTDPTGDNWSWCN